MVITLYDEDMSPPCQAVNLTARALGVPLTIKAMDMFVKMDHKTPEYLKMNPCHTIPTINDDGFCLWESRAIMAYLVNQYGKNDSLYPKDPKKRALVDNMLQFDLGTLYNSFANYLFPPVFAKKPENMEEKIKMIERLEILDNILAKRKYVAGDQMTIADISTMCSLHAPICCGFDISPYKRITEWRNRMKTKDMPYFDEVTAAGVKNFMALVQKMK